MDRDEFTDGLPVRQALEVGERVKFGISWTGLAIPGCSYQALLIYCLGNLVFIPGSCVLSLTDNPSVSGMVVAGEEELVDLVACAALIGLGRYQPDQLVPDARDDRRGPLFSRNVYPW